MASPLLVVIGGGAAGFFGAIRAKSLAPTLRVVILEAAPKCLGKVKISGGGRCNVTHACFDVGRLVQFYPRGQRELKSVFTRFGPADTVAWFESHGVKLKTEADGRMFPISDDSQTIIDCLLAEARRLGIEIHTRAPVRNLVRRPDGGFSVETPEKTWDADRVLLASGSNRESYGWLSAMGHQIIPPVPSLFTFRVADPALQALSGISFPRVTGKLSVAGQKPISQEGPLLITHWGLSGPVILRLSAWGARLLADSHYQGTLFVDFFPDISQPNLLAQLEAMKTEHHKKHLGQGFSDALPKRFWHYFLGTQGLAQDTIWAETSQKTLNRWAEVLKNQPFPIAGKGPFKEEFVTAGGVQLKDIDFKTMESRVAPGLHLAGEVLDVDALTGGFNFQNAWSTGWISGETAGHTA